MTGWLEEECAMGRSTGTVWVAPRTARYAGRDGSLFAVRVVVAAAFTAAWYACIPLAYYRLDSDSTASTWVWLAALVGLLGVPFVAAWSCWHGCLGAWATRRRDRRSMTAYAVAAAIGAGVLAVYASPWNQAIAQRMLD
jgi:hypothetical protein